MMTELTQSERDALDAKIKSGYFLKTNRWNGKCKCCGRTLTDPESLKRGYGPECASKLNNQPPTEIES